MSLSQMRLKEAIEKAEKDENVKKLKKDCFLGSGFRLAEKDEWTLHFYNLFAKKTIDVEVGSDFVIVDEEKPLLKEAKELDVNKIHIDSETAMEEAKKHIRGKPLETTIVAHTKDEKTVWTITFIMPGLAARTFDIDAENGKLLSEKFDSLLR